MEEEKVVMLLIKSRVALYYQEFCEGRSDAAVDKEKRKMGINVIMSILDKTS